MNASDSDDLSAKLQAWTVEPQVPGSFQRGVWQRISARQAARRESFWPQLLAWASAQLARPLYALAFVIVTLSASIGVAHIHAQDTNARLDKILEARYAASVDPLSMNR